MITNQISDWYAAPQTVTVDDMTNLSQDLYQRIAQIAYGKIPCILNMSGAITINNNIINIPSGNFIFNETNLNFLTYQTFPIGNCQTTSLNIANLTGYIVARYTINPLVEGQTSYKINTTYVYTNSINNTTDVLICTLKNGDVIQNGIFLFSQKQYNITNLLKFNLNNSTSGVVRYPSPLITNSKDFCSIINVVNESGFNFSHYFRAYDGISFTDMNIRVDNTPLEFDYYSIYSINTTNNTNIMALSKDTTHNTQIGSIPINWDYVTYKKINDGFYFFSSNYLNHQGVIIFNSSISNNLNNVLYTLFPFCQMIYDILFYNNKWYLSTDTGIYSGTDLSSSASFALINGIIVGSYYFKIYNNNGNNIMILINSSYSHNIGIGTTNYYYLSNDGINFTKQISVFIAANEQICNIESNEKIFIATTFNPDITQCFVYQSFDAINWTKINTYIIPDSLDNNYKIFYKLKYINNKFLLIQTTDTGQTDTIQIYYSDDGIIWGKTNINGAVLPTNDFNKYDMYNNLNYYNGSYQFFGKNSIYSFTLSERG